MRVKKTGTAKPRAGAKGSADKFLPDKFVRAHAGKDRVFERVGDGWTLDGNGPMPLRKAMAELMGDANAKGTSFVRYFAAGKIRKPEDAA